MATSNNLKEQSNIRELVSFSGDRKFDTRTLPADMQRIYKGLAKAHGEEYALHVIFTIRTAVELHRAWHMTLLTNKILQQLKRRFRLRMTWSLGVFRLQFRMSDGEADLYRRVPYDYDSEYQDIFMRVAIALMDDEIDIHEALIYQAETVKGVHTAKSGLFLRDFPGRLLLYPGVASTCAVIFFNGDWTDFGIAALCGLATGLVEMILGRMNLAILTDTCVGATVGIIGGLFFRYGGQDVCLSSIFLGTLYWFFYGTAFVLGILEIIAGELQTGVTRFIAVAVKTFVLCLGASFGLLVVGDAQDAWYKQADNCNRLDIDRWWRIPMYLLCSIFVLGQYRFPIVRYWRACVVMVVGYEVQYEVYNAFARRFGGGDNIDTAISNVFGCATAVISACMLSYYINSYRYYFDAPLLAPGHKDNKSTLGKFIHGVLLGMTKIETSLGLGRRGNYKMRVAMEKKLSEKSRSSDGLKFDVAEENLIIDTIVDTQDMNIWSIMMPALYQLVPGSLIAKLWFNYIFPPRLIEIPIEGLDNITQYQVDQDATNVFGGLMIVSTSLALGLIVGFAVVQIFQDTLELCGFGAEWKTSESAMRAKDLRTGMYSSTPPKEENPESVAEELKNLLSNDTTRAIRTDRQVNKLFDAIDIDQSGQVDEGEVSYYMLKAGLTKEQIKKLFAAMDEDSSGEVSREEFCRQIQKKSNEDLLTVHETVDTPVEEQVYIEEKNDEEDVVPKEEGAKEVVAEQE